MAIIEVSAQLEGHADTKAGAGMMFSCSAVCRGMSGGLGSRRNPEPPAEAPKANPKPS